jgi:hypothetical protein
VIKFVSDLLQVDGFLQVLVFPPPIKLTITINFQLFHDNDGWMKICNDGWMKTTNIRKVKRYQREVIRICILKKTENKMVKRNRTKRQTMINKILHRKLKIEQHEPRR